MSPNNAPDMCSPSQGDFPSSSQQAVEKEGISPGSAKNTIRDTGNLTQVGCVQ